MIGGARRWTLVLALLGIVLSIVPFLGLALASTALVLAVRGLRAGTSPRGTVGIAVLGLLLSAACTAGYVACAPSQETPEEGRTWREFDRLFAPETPGGAGNPQGNPRVPRPAP